MASRATLTVLFGFYAVFCCLDLLKEATATLIPAVLITLALTPLLTYAHVWALGRANAGGAGARFVARLAEATLLAAVVALLSGAAVRLGLGAGEVPRLGGADDVGWLG
ncbi:hypothetical protein SEVIR_4G036100v4 [Setaria viridis]|uniref:Uncharacterized protein n=1 Tax=Setaria viridis TaxID=4556 RepID=A0A4U6V726_SETVI|nr:uncharacterized protein LOC117852710 [Setaria viridis]TKW19677.1 hypothetical protein SEVIR_4G036100v2 [Setaria viridis]